MRAAPHTVIAVASGKGGTGKTSLAVHLALCAASRAHSILVDLDVEAPDSLAYFPQATESGEAQSVLIRVPRFHKEACTGCGLCGKACRFGALFSIGKVVSVNDKICKGCGACVYACPAGALTEEDIRVGQSSGFDTGSLAIIEGKMDIGDIRATTVIEATKSRAAALNAQLEIRDCPPGTSCTATHSIEGAHYVILVAEPTEFSLHDLRGALRLVSERGMRAGVVINKDGFSSADIESACAEYNFPVIGRIPFLRERAVSGAAARLWTDDKPLMSEVEAILAKALAGAEEASPC